MEDKDKVLLIDELLALTKDLALQHNRGHISDYSAWITIRDIIHNNYPKSCVLYLTGQKWQV